MRFRVATLFPLAFAIGNAGVRCRNEGSGYAG